MRQRVWLPDAAAPLPALRPGGLQAVPARHEGHDAVGDPGEVVERAVLEVERLLILRELKPRMGNCFKCWSKIFYLF